jgi:hypothetical protein
MSSYGLDRRNSSLKPLLNFESQENLAQGVGKGMPASKSVFGVDTLWDRETARLKEIEAQERVEAEERERREALQGKKKGKKGKGKGKDLDPSTSSLSLPVAEEPPVPRLSADPPVLPAIPKASRGPPPRVDEDEAASESDESAKGISKVQKKPTNAWSDSDDEAEVPVRTTGVGLRYRQGSLGQKPKDDSSDEDVPLAQVRKTSVRRQAPADSDEELPLAALMEKSKLGIPSIDFDKNEDEDEDDQPLGLRSSRVVLGEEEDDKPLAFHPDQQRRTQYQMIAQQQQQQMLMAQQQQQMMAAHQSMFFAPPSMMGGPAFFGPPAGPQMMMPPMAFPSPPPSQDANKFGRVDRWRRDVATEGDE